MPCPTGATDERRGRSIPARLILLLLAGLFLVVPVTAASAATTSGTERIQDYRVAVELAADGSMHVEETIRYDFGGTADRHGIFRTIPTSVTFDEERDRKYPITDIDVSSPTGAPADFEKTTTGGVLTLKIGDADEEVEGVQDYVISYDVDGALNNFDDHQELYWNLVGTYWDAPIDRVEASVTGPVAATRTACFEGAQGSTQQCENGTSGNASTFTATGLQAREGLTAVVAYPLGTFPGAGPILEERHTVADAFEVSPASVGGGVAALAVLGGGVGWLVSRKGRDEKYLGVIPGLEPGRGDQVNTSRVGFRRDPVVVQFHPPEDMRPGVLGTLIDEKADVVDVTATIIDLAVRGYLRIEEVEQARFFRDGDWRLVATPPPAGAEGLHDYEQKLLTSIFEGRDQVLLSDLKQHFRSDLTSVQNWLYKEVVSRHWFRGNPSTVRAVWAGIGVLAVAAGIGLTVLLGIFTNLAWIGVGVTIAAFGLLIASPKMPSRTASGTAALAQALGFRRYLETAEANQIRFEEGQDVFSRYLPYAIVFGVADRWAKVFGDLAASGVDVAVPSWYVGHYAGATFFNYAAFGGAVDSFSSVASGSISAPTPSSSGGSGFGGGGFSGGGGGGGGGGSW